jgi:DNA primase
VATLAAGHDPDTFLRQEGAVAFEARCAAARNLLLYAIDRIFGEEDTASLRGKNTGVARVALLLSKVQDADEALELGRDAARRLGVDPSDLWNQAQRLVTVKAAPPASVIPPQSLALFERDLLQLLLQVPEARAALLPRSEPEYVAHPGLRRLLAALRAHPDVDPGALVQRLEDETERALLSQLLLEEPSWEDAGGLILDMQRRLDFFSSRRRARELTQAVHQAQAQGNPEVSDLQVALQRVGKLIPDMTAPKSHPPEDRRP